MSEAAGLSAQQALESSPALKLNAIPIAAGSKCPLYQCDSCNNQIQLDQGEVRFNSMQKLDYDLCSSCFNKLEVDRQSQLWYEIKQNPEHKSEQQFQLCYGKVNLEAEMKYKL